MILFHQDEEATTMVLYRYFREHKGSCVQCLMEDGLRFTAKFDTAYEADNGDDEAYENGQVPYTEYLALALRVVKVDTPVPDGPQPDSLFEIWYGHFPIEITDENGEVLYCAK